MESGLVDGLPAVYPGRQFFAPVLTALAFIHYELARLEKTRAQTVMKIADDDGSD